MNQEVLDFYNRNKDYKYISPKLPAGLSTIEAARWVMTNPEFAWVELDLEIPDLSSECIAAEPYYVPHREGESNGWSSCCIHGIRTDTTQNWPEYVDKETDNLYRWTELSEKVPLTTQFWKSYPSETFKRVRYMKVSPGGYISQHSDAPGRGHIPGEPADTYDPLVLGCPVNIALIHPENCHMVLENFGVVPFKPNKAFLINIRHYHAVLNFSNQERIHMIGFGVYGNRREQFADLIIRSFLKNEYN